ncbi:hypothetical protein AB5N19_11219 [Seiridium cardinale]|uniref:BZIP domain-containing protein n=1 Tax=Seiridium cardinale TaxID=138064 RepID=A0ABR2XS73_9PEZI
MSMSSDKAALDKANLTRIRDNQRRSRARRKEYVQELEQRLRVYEQQGVEASTEIQQAARRVVEENKKLRALLNEHGIGDSSIDSFLQSPGATVGSGPQTSAHTQESAAQVLDRLLATSYPPDLDSDVATLLPSSEFDRESRRDSITFSTSSVDTSVNRPPLSLAARETRHSGPTHTYGSLDMSDDAQAYGQDLSTFASGSGQSYDVGRVPPGSTSHRPSLYRSKQPISDPTGMWTDTPQISPSSALPLQANLLAQSHMYLGHPIQFAQHQAPTFSTHWPSHIGSEPSTGSSGILSDGYTPLMPNDPMQSEDYGDQMEEDTQEFDETTFHGSSGHFSSRNMRP